MRLFSKKSRVRAGSRDLAFDEVLLESGISRAQDERAVTIMEKPFSRFSYALLICILSFFGLMLLGRTIWLSVGRGEAFAARADSNRLQREVFTADRGVIYDRKGNVLVENKWLPDEKRTERMLIDPNAFSHLIGFLGRPDESDISADESLIDFIALGRDGVEYSYDELLRGEVGERLQEVDALGNIISSGFSDPPQQGKNLTLTIDRELQLATYRALSTVVDERGFHGGAAVIFNAKNGEILTLMSYPSFDANAFSKGITKEAFSALVSDSRSPLFNRAIGGRYQPGSIIKPFLAYAALIEGIISPERQILSTGVLNIPDPFHRGQVISFADWRAHGWVDLRHAISVSSNVYFYTVGGGYGDIQGLGVRRWKQWLDRFRFNEKSGIDLVGEKEAILPDPDMKPERHPDDPIWRIGDTYHASIGQGDFAITPMQVVVGLSAIVNGDKMIRPHVLLEVEHGNVPSEIKETYPITLDPEDLEVIREGMILAAKEGTAQALRGHRIQMAAKTGTAEFGRKDRTHSWFMGYSLESSEPMGMVVFLESGPRSNLVGGTSVALQILNWIADHGGVDQIFSRSE